MDRSQPFLPLLVRALILVKPETVVSWHRAGFEWFWRWRSRPRRLGRPAISGETRQLIRRMKAENPTWGAPRLHDELLHLGFAISEPTVSRYLLRLKHHCHPEKAKRWLTFLNNHREVIAALDFFTVPTLRFRILYCFFVIEHGRRKILFFHATAHPTSDWILQQLREAFALPCPYRYVIFDRDAKFSPTIREFLLSSGLKPIPNQHPQSVGQEFPSRVARSCNPAECGTFTVARQRISRVLSRGPAPPRTGKEHADKRSIEHRWGQTSQVVAVPRIGALHHRYIWAAAARPVPRTN